MLSAKPARISPKTTQCGSQDNKTECGNRYIGQTRGKNYCGVSRRIHNFGSA
jgi:hypothetical protein